MVSPRAVLWSVINWILILGILAVNILSVALPMNGRTPGQITDSFHLLFDPAGYVFSIWGLIYLGLLAFGVYQVLPSQQFNPRIRATDGLFAATCIANAGWLFAWHYGLYILSMVAILVLLFALSAIYLFMRGREYGRTMPDWTARAFVLAPFSLYLAWICVSAIANTAALLTWAGLRETGLSAEGWAIVFCFVTAILSVFMSLRHREVVFPAVVVWALAGEIVRQSQVREIVIGCAISIAVTVLGAVAGLVLRRPEPAWSLDAQPDARPVDN